MHEGKEREGKISAGSNERVCIRVETKRKTRNGAPAIARKLAPTVVEERPGDFEELRCFNCNRFLIWVAGTELTIAAPCPTCKGWTVIDITQAPGATPIPNVIFELRPVKNDDPIDKGRNVAVESSKGRDANAGLGLGPLPGVKGKSETEDTP